MHVEYYLNTQYIIKHFEYSIPSYRLPLSASRSVNKSLGYSHYNFWRVYHYNKWRVQDRSIKREIKRGGKEETRKKKKKSSPYSCLGNIGCMANAGSCCCYSNISYQNKSESRKRRSAERAHYLSKLTKGRDKECISRLRLNKVSFDYLCELLRVRGLLQDPCEVTVEE